MRQRLLHIQPRKVAANSLTSRIFYALVFLGLSSAVIASNPGPEAPGKLVGTNGILVHINCIGTGQPTILLEAGLGGNSLEWHPVQRQLSDSSRVCSYDRPGYGWSEIASTPRNARTIARELKLLLDKSGETGPFLLVGHSFGGHVVRLYANEFGPYVAGIVLLDASHERLFDFLKGDHSTMLVTIKAPQSYTPKTPKNLPESLKPVFAKLSRRPETKETIQNETFYFRRSAAEVSWHPELPEVPIMVISRGNQGVSKDNTSNSISKNWLAMQKDLHQRLSDSKHVIASNSGHFPHLDEPDLIANTILEMLSTIRAR